MGPPADRSACASDEKSSEGTHHNFLTREEVQDEGLDQVKYIVERNVTSRHMYMIRQYHNNRKYGKEFILGFR